MKPLIRQLNALASIPKTNVGLLSFPFRYKISNLIFTDDWLLFAKASSKGAKNIFGILNNFAKATGQKINVHKSSLHFSSNTTNQLRSEIVNILQIQHKTTIGKYLGNCNMVFLEGEYPLQGR